MTTISKIEWTQQTWNPTVGCTKISPGCKHCYAEMLAKRLQAMGTPGYENGFQLTLLPQRLNDPFVRKRPTIYFVNSMSDLFHENVYLNYGALTLATAAKQHGYNPVLVHGNHSDPEAFVEALREQTLLPTSHPVLLSLPSFLALAWAARFCRHVKKLFPQSVIVAGGRWVVNPDVTWLKRKIPQIDLFIKGLGEGLIPQIVEASHWPTFDAQENVITSPYSTALPGLHMDHRIVQDFQLFQPSIEVSRGCGMGCAFCEERAAQLSPLLAPDVLASYMVETMEQYGDTGIHPYFQSSYFLPNPRWARKVLGEVEARGCTLHWRCETRADCLTAETIELLAKTGLRIIDLGLESASPQQLLRMSKTRNPDKYLKRASEALRNCAENGIWVKANVLLYAGETHTTIDETTSWLREHTGLIKGISVGPVMVFGPPEVASLFWTQNRASLSG